MIDRFDLEQAIMNAWTITEDIQTLYEYFGNIEVLTQDSVANALLGLKELQEARQVKLWTIFERYIHDQKENSKE